jgi:hypothetical protein
MLYVQEDSKQHRRKEEIAEQSRVSVPTARLRRSRPDPRGITPAPRETPPLPPTQGLGVREDPPIPVGPGLALRPRSSVTVTNVTVRDRGHLRCRGSRGARWPPATAGPVGPARSCARCIPLRLTLPTAAQSAGPDWGTPRRCCV